LGELHPATELDSQLPERRCPDVAEKSWFDPMGEEALIYLLSLYLSIKRSHHVRWEGLEISTLIQKREEYTPLDFMKI
jgi:hypothetical protein